MRSWWRLKSLSAKPFLQSQHPAKFSGHKSRESEDMCLKLLLGFTFLTCPKGHVVLRVEVSYSKSALCLVWYVCAFCNWKCNVFNLSLDLTRLPHWGVMLIYGWELLALNHHSDELGDHKHCDSVDKMLLICHGTSRDPCLQGFVNLLAEGSHSKSQPCHVWWPLV